MDRKASTDNTIVSCGVWITASYINHSCIDNCVRSFMGDMMIVRASKNLKANTELKFWYQAPIGEGGIEEQQESFRRNWEFACTCALCKSLEETPASTFKTRRELLDKIQSLCSKKPADEVPTEEVQRLINTINGTYDRPAREIPRLALWGAHYFLANIYLAKEQYLNTLNAIGKTLVALGFVCRGLEAGFSTGFRVVEWGHLFDLVVEMFRSAAAAFNALGRVDDAKAAKSYSKMAYRIMVGEDGSYDASVAGYPVTE